MTTEQSAWVAYKEQLINNLIELGEEGFLALVETLGYDYAKLPGQDITEKAVKWMQELDNKGFISDLALSANQKYPELDWDNPLQPSGPNRNYYVASSIKQGEDQYKAYIINRKRFLRVANVREADFIIFDLDHPPANWIKFLKQFQYETILFVQFEQPDASQPSVVTLNGSSILSLLKSDEDGNTSLHFCQTLRDMYREISKVDRQLRREVERNINQEALRQISLGSGSARDRG